MVEEVVDKVNKIKRSGVVVKLSIEEQKLILLAPTMTQFDEYNNQHLKLLLSTRNSLTKYINKNMLKVLDSITEGVPEIDKD